MLRVVFIKLGDKEYPLVNSLYVAERIERIDNMQSVKSLAVILEAMMYAGAKYLNIVGSPNKNLNRNENGDIVPLSKEDISILLGVDEDTIRYISGKISECFAVSDKKQVVAKSNAKKKKNR